MTPALAKAAVGGAVPAAAVIVAISISTPLGLRRLRREVSVYTCPTCRTSFNSKRSYREHYSVRHSARFIPEPERTRNLLTRSG
jgi:hypothetical protein